MTVDVLTTRRYTVHLSDLPKPEISNPKDVLIKVHAASINPIDVKKASGMLKMAVRDE